MSRDKTDASMAVFVAKVLDLLLHMDAEGLAQAELLVDKIEQELSEPAKCPPARRPARKPANN